MLDHALRTSYDVGANVRGEQVDTTWLFLLDDLRIRCLVGLGALRAGELVALAAVADEVTVVVGNRVRRWWLKRMVDRRSLAVRIDGNVTLAGADLVIVSSRSSLRDGHGLERVVARGGAVLVRGRIAARSVGSVAERLGARRLAVVSPADGREPEDGGDGPTAWSLPPAPRPVPLGRAWTLVHRARSRFRRRPGGGPEGPLRVAAVDEPVRAPAWLGGDLLVDGARTHPLDPPAYVLDAAATAGIDLSDARWSLAPPRGYRSQKVVFFVRSGAHDLVVKVTQDGRFNDRLANEFHALGSLVERGLDRVVRAPRAVFAAEHAGLLAVGESRIDGVAFRDRSEGGPGDPLVEEVVRTIRELASASRRTAIDARTATAALLALVDHYAGIYRPPAKHRAALHEEVASLGGAVQSLPTVFGHGDLTTLNVLVDDDGAIGLLDWENAEPAGVPMWDLLYFAQAIASWWLQRQGAASAPVAVIEHLLRPTPHHDALAGWSADYRRALDLPLGAARPLFFACWVQVALREARRLPLGRVSEGRWYRALDLLLARRNDDRLDELLGGRS